MVQNSLIKRQDPRLQGRAPGFRGGGVTGKGQDRNKTGDKTESR